MLTSRRDRYQAIACFTFILLAAIYGAVTEANALWHWTIVVIALAWSIFGIYWHIKNLISPWDARYR